LSSRPVQQGVQPGGAVAQGGGVGEDPTWLGPWPTSSGRRARSAAAAGARDGEGGLEPGQVPCLGRRHQRQPFSEPGTLRIGGEVAPGQYERRVDLVGHHAHAVSLGEGGDASSSWRCARCRSGCAGCTADTPRAARPRPPGRTRLPERRGRSADPPPAAPRPPAGPCGRRTGRTAGRRASSPTTASPGSVTSRSISTTPSMTSGTIRVFHARPSQPQRFAANAASASA
jgi:hypothetical protein